VVVVGLTGGIGSGKSTVAALLAARGAAVVDADAVAREVVAPGGSAHDAVVLRFGPGVVAPGGEIDRPALAALVFADEAARADLNGLVHPAVHHEMLRRLADVGAHRPDAVVVLDVPLLAEVGSDRYQVSGVLVVDAPVEVAVARLVAERGFDEEAARARVAAQASREERRAVADRVIDNAGDLAHLEAEVDRAWSWILGLPPAG
jgi:dephospho-CoA kinase